MNRILILLASLLVVGCPQQSYRSSNPEFVSPYTNLTHFIWCVKETGVFKSSRNSCRWAEGKVFSYEDRNSADSYYELLKNGEVVIPTPSPEVYFCVKEDVDPYWFRSDTPCGVGESGVFKSFGSEDEAVAYFNSLHNWCANKKTLKVYKTLKNYCASGSKQFDSEAEARAYLEPFSTLCVTPDGMTIFTTTHQRCGDMNGKAFPLDKRSEAEAYLAALKKSRPTSPEIPPAPTPTPTPAPTPTPEPDYQLVSTGTGFVVNKFFVVTADHVLRKNERGDACDALSIVYRKEEYEAQGVDADPANDLGLIKLSKPIESTAKLRGQPDLIQGEMAVNYGFPLMGELSTSAKVTGGSVNSLSGYNNNSSFLQYDAASQHGNSGGPVLDASGNIIGVVSSKLDDAETQLVNFATKSTILEGFLKSNNVAFEKEDLGEELRLSEIAKKAEAFTVLVGCWE